MEITPVSFDMSKNNEKDEEDRWIFLSWYDFLVIRSIHLLCLQFDILLNGLDYMDT